MGAAPETGASNIRKTFLAYNTLKRGEIALYPASVRPTTQRRPAWPGRRPTHPALGMHGIKLAHQMAGNSALFQLLAGQALQESFNVLAVGGRDFPSQLMTSH